MKSSETKQEHHLKRHMPTALPSAFLLRAHDAGLRPKLQEAGPGVTNIERGLPGHSMEGPVQMFCLPKNCLHEKNFG